MAGYQVVNRSRSVPSRALVRVCGSRWAPCLDHCICCFLAKRQLTTRLTVDSTKAVEIRSPVRRILKKWRRSPRFWSDALSDEMGQVSNSVGRDAEAIPKVGPE